MIIPETTLHLYAPIVFISILIGVFAACALMHKAGVSRQTVLYTALLTFVMIVVVSFMMSVILNGSIFKIGFVGAGGALGLMLGAVISALIHREKVPDSVAAWIVSAPLMYALSKVACHVTGCCNGIPYDGPFHVAYESKGGASFFPVQLTETVVFLMIFVIGLVLYLKLTNRMRAAVITVVLSCIAKVGIEFLRQSHMGKTISRYQILVIVLAVIFIAISIPVGKISEE